ncbi:MAG: DUF3307 domain-containing protein [Calditrichaeota bacterium]|nr:DUF3307 domain-containing protein [Calditrichota bacterium]
MDLFWLLVLAHLVGDFPLQTDTIFHYKNKYKWGILLHVSICAVMNMVFTIPFLGYPSFWLVLFILFISHVFYDSGKIWITQTVLKDNIFLFLFDQFLHFATIWLVTVFFLGIHTTLHIDYSMPFYSDRTLVIQLSGFVFAVFALAPLVFYVQQFINSRLEKKKRKNLVFPEFRERVPGYVERFLLVLFAFLGGWFWLGVLIVFGARVLLRGEFDWPTLIFGNAVAVLTGLLI